MAGSGEWLRELCTCVILIGRRVPCDMRFLHTASQAALNVGGMLHCQPKMMNNYAGAWIGMHRNKAISSCNLMHAMRCYLASLRLL